MPRTTILPPGFRADRGRAAAPFDLVDLPVELEHTRKKCSMRQYRTPGAGRSCFGFGVAASASRPHLDHVTVQLVVHIEALAVLPELRQQRQRAAGTPRSTVTTAAAAAWLVQEVGDRPVVARVSADPRPPAGVADSQTLYLGIAAVSPSRRAPDRRHAHDQPYRPPGRVPAGRTWCESRRSGRRPPPGRRSPSDCGVDPLAPVRSELRSTHRSADQ
jgi:hypothetical protein